MLNGKHAQGRPATARGRDPAFANRAGPTHRAARSCEGSAPRAARRTSGKMKHGNGTGTGGSMTDITEDRAAIVRQRRISADTPGGAVRTIPKSRPVLRGASACIARRPARRVQRAEPGSSGHRPSCPASARRSAPSWQGHSPQNADFKPEYGIRGLVALRALLRHGDRPALHRCWRADLT